LEPIAHYYFTELAALHGHAAFSDIWHYMLHQEISRHREDLRFRNTRIQAEPLDELGFEICDPILMHDFSGNWLGGRHVKPLLICNTIPEVEKLVAEIIEKRSTEARLVAQITKRNAQAQKKRLDTGPIGG